MRGSEIPCSDEFAEPEKEKVEGSEEGLPKVKEGEEEPKEVEKVKAVRLLLRCACLSRPSRLPIWWSSQMQRGCSQKTTSTCQMI